ncbi:MAG: DEAD/DEAH box helicase [Chlamydiia bacterium]|nr:DEAD/DEAH box helicase [Chlamydiia bacterium]
MLNFRKLKKDYSPTVIKDGRELYENKMVESVKVVSMTPQIIRLSCRVAGAFENTYSCELEIDRTDSTATDTNCDCPHNLDCQHITAVFFYLEENLNQLVLDYAKETNLDDDPDVDDEEKETLLEEIEQVKTKEAKRQDVRQQKELLEEYLNASEVLGQSPFFLPEENMTQDKAELAVIFTPKGKTLRDNYTEIHLALRLPYRSKPLYIQDIRVFLDAIRYNEALYLGNKRFYFTLGSFDDASSHILKLIINYARTPEERNDRNMRIVEIDAENFGTILSEMCKISQERYHTTSGEPDQLLMPCLYIMSLEEPLCVSPIKASLQFGLEYLEAPAPKLLINPTIMLDAMTTVTMEEVTLYGSARPGLIYENTYYRFHDNIRRRHLRNLESIRSVTIPEPLFGTFIENSLPELHRYVNIKNKEALDKFATLPFVENVGAECDINYLNGELEASLTFVYGNIKVPAAPSKLEYEHITPFVTEQGILARNLTEEQKIIDELFQDFFYDPSQGLFIAKNDKIVVEFMTDVVPQFQDKVQFICPENLLDQFIYDNTSFIMKLRETDRIDMYEVDLTVDGDLNGISLNALWECISAKRSFIELSRKKTTKKRSGKSSSKSHKILVLDLEQLTPLVQLFDEIGISQLDNHVEQRPLWSLASIDETLFEGLPVKFSMTKKLKEIREQMLGVRNVKVRTVSKQVKADLRSYQTEGVQWLERLRQMHLNGILADDMGLGKTLQAIAVITQDKIDNPKNVSLIVCPTSLVYNWKEEFHKFNPKLKTLIIDGTPTQRKRLVESIDKYDVVITSYSLLQKDIENYQNTVFGYAVLDEAQHIKNRGTRNAKSVKIIQAQHRLILTGTPIENSLDEMWSLFDFLMPGLLSSYDRFVEKYIRSPSQDKTANLENLRKKVQPFILRRMKKDVLEDLPPVSEITYHCHLSDTQRELYSSYAKSAREELSQLVEKEGFDKVQIHVLATLTRLKQICCHPAIFAKENPEIGDSAKYEMLMELLQTLIEGKHKTVIFSQYTKMLQIIKQDLLRQGITFEYLDGSTKDRLEIVKRFNDDPSTPIFLVSLKAGGVGLNLTGADTVIHFDLWWNPAVENQATDRVHRIGQKQAVSSYKLVTLNTIEEKIVELQERKRGLVKKIVSCDEEVISKLTWEEVLELLQT